MRAVFFDFDGVLVDSEPLHYRALRESLLAADIIIDEDEYARTYVGYDDRETIRVALEIHRRPSSREHVESIIARKVAAFEALLADIPFFPGARALVQALSEVVPVAIVSGARHDEIERIVRAGGLRERFTCIVGADDVRNTKPHPEPYLAALRHVQAREADVRAGDCLVVEDSMPGVAAGRAAGMKVLAVTHTHPASRLGGAHHVVPSLAQLSPESLRALF
jgi:HAD superfamily hydrolase (TIGR01509 family)